MIPACRAACERIAIAVSPLADPSQAAGGKQRGVSQLPELVHARRDNIAARFTLQYGDARSNYDLSGRLNAIRNHAFALGGAGGRFRFLTHL